MNSFATILLTTIESRIKDKWDACLRRYWYKGVVKYMKNTKLSYKHNPYFQLRKDTVFLLAPVVKFPWSGIAINYSQYLNDFLKSRLSNHRNMCTSRVQGNRFVDPQVLNCAKFTGYKEKFFLYISMGRHPSLKHDFESIVKCLLTEYSTYLECLLINRLRLNTIVDYSLITVFPNYNTLCNITTYRIIYVILV